LSETRDRLPQSEAQLEEFSLASQIPLSQVSTGEDVGFATGELLGKGVGLREEKRHAVNVQESD
jgi:hypothetical protein